jgi:hypothetical protein
MNATYTIEAAAALEPATVKAQAREVAGALKTTMMMAAAPLLGLAFVIALPIAGLAAIAWMLLKPMVRNRAAIGERVKRIALFLVAPFVALVYVGAFPFIAMGMLIYQGVRAARS